MATVGLAVSDGLEVGAIVFRGVVVGDMVTRVGEALAVGVMVTKVGEELAVIVVVGRWALDGFGEWVAAKMAVLAGGETAVGLDTWLVG